MLLHSTKNLINTSKYILYKVKYKKYINKLATNKMIEWVENQALPIKSPGVSISIFRKTFQRIFIFRRVLNVIMDFSKPFHMSDYRPNYSILNWVFETQSLKNNKKNLKCFRLSMLLKDLNPLSTNITKWSNTLKQFVGKLPTDCLSVFDHFVILALKGLRTKTLIQ